MLSRCATSDLHAFLTVLLGVVAICPFLRVPWLKICAPVWRSAWPCHQWPSLERFK